MRDLVRKQRYKDAHEHTDDNGGTMTRLPKYAAKRDTNERQIVQALRMIPGVTVYSASAPGKPDLEVGFRGQNFKLEIKSAKGKLTAPERDFFDMWTGQCDIVRSVDEALRVIGAIE